MTPICSWIIKTDYAVTKGICLSFKQNTNKIISQQIFAEIRQWRLRGLHWVGITYNGWQGAQWRHQDNGPGSAYSILLCSRAARHTLWLGRCTATVAAVQFSVLSVPLFESSVEWTVDTTPKEPSSFQYTSKTDCRRHENNWLSYIDRSEWCILLISRFWLSLCLNCVLSLFHFVHWFNLPNCQKLAF